MATSQAFLIVEQYIRESWLQSKLGQPFTKRSGALRANGSFEFDAVSLDGQIVACISANSGRAKNGGFAKTKMNKVRSDIMFLMLSEAPQKLMILADPDLYAHSISEQQRGRLPAEIRILQAELSPEIGQLLAKAQNAASIEIVAEA